MLTLFFFELSLILAVFLGFFVYLYWQQRQRDNKTVEVLLKKISDKDTERKERIHQFLKGSFKLSEEGFEKATIYLLQQEKLFYKKLLKSIIAKEQDAYLKTYDAFLGLLQGYYDLGPDISIVLEVQEESNTLNNESSSKNVDEALSEAAIGQDKVSIEEKVENTAELEAIEQSDKNLAEETQNTVLEISDENGSAMEDLPEEIKFEETDNANIALELTQPNNEPTEILPVQENNIKEIAPEVHESESLDMKQDKMIESQGTLASEALDITEVHDEIEAELESMEENSHTEHCVMEFAVNLKREMLPAEDIVMYRVKLLTYLEARGLNNEHIQRVIHGEE